MDRQSQTAEHRRNPDTPFHSVSPPKGRPRMRAKASSAHGDDGRATIEGRQERAFDFNAAGWGHRETYAEGPLGGEAVAQIRAARASLRSVARAFDRHSDAIGRSADSLRRALGRSASLANALRENPQAANALFGEKRIKITKPMRENVFLAAVKLASPDTAPNTLTRWAGALAFAAATGCAAEDVQSFLRKTGIREAADRWTEIRRIAKPLSKRITAPKPDPIDDLRKHSLDVALSGSIPLPEDAEGPFLFVVERADTGMVVHGLTNHRGLVNKVSRVIVHGQRLPAASA